MLVFFLWYYDLHSSCCFVDHDSDRRDIMCNCYTCTCIHFFTCKPICTINVYDKHSVFSPDGLIHPFINLALSSHLSVLILIIILT